MAIADSVRTATGDGAPSTEHGPTDVEQLRRTVAKLEAENADLRLQVAAGGVHRHRTSRTIVAIAMVVVAGLLVPVALTGAWLRTTLLDTDRYVETVAPLARDASVQAEAATTVTRVLFERVDVERVIREALPDRAAFLAEPLTTNLQSLVRDTVNRILASDQFIALWDRANRLAHEQLVAVLTNASGRAGVVQVDLSGVVDEATAKLRDLGIPLFDEARSAPVLVDVVKSDEIARLQGAFALFDRMASVLPWITLLLLAGAVVVAPTRRKGLVYASTALLGGTIGSLLAVDLGRELYLTGLPAGASIGANEAVFDTLTRFFRDGARTLAAFAIVALAAALVTGPSAPARALRRASRRAIDRLGEVGPRQGSIGAVRAFAARNLTALRLAVAGVGVVVLLAQSRPSGASILAIAGGTLLALAVVEVVARGGVPATPSRTTAAS